MKTPVIISGILSLLALVLSGLAHAATITVTDNAFSGPGTLRQALLDASPGDTIDFATRMDGAGFIGPFEITTDVVIDATDLPNGIRLSGPSTDRTVRVTGGKNVTLWGVRIINAAGGIYNDGGLLTVRDCEISGHIVTNDQGGGIHSVSGTVWVVNSTISGNRAGTISNNYYGGGIYSRDTALSLIHSSVISNRSSVAGGGIRLRSGTLFMENSIVALNRSDYDDSGDREGDDIARHPDGTVNTYANNLIGTNDTVETEFPAGPLTNVDPLLGSLAFNGGPTRNHLPSTNSPVLDAASFTPGTPPFDQRGARRNDNLFPELGAVERITSNLVVTVTNGFGEGSLRYVTAFSASTNITFDSALSGQVLRLDGHAIDLGSVSIDASSVPGGITISGSSTSGIFEANGDVTLRNLTLIDGSDLTVDSQNNLFIYDCVISNITAFAAVRTSSDGIIVVSNSIISDVSGHGLFANPNSGGDVRVIDSAFRRCGNAGIFLDVGFITVIDTEITDCLRGLESGTFSGSFGSNRLEHVTISGTTFGSGLSVVENTYVHACRIVDNNQRGIDAFGSVDLDVIDSVIASNTGGIYAEGPLYVERTAIVDNSTFSDGGAIYSRDYTTLINCTLAGNQAARGGAIAHTLQQMTLNHVTCVNNTATNGGGIWLPSGAVALFVENSVIASNTAPAGADIYSAGSVSLIPRGTNLIGDNSTVAAAFPPSDLVGTSLTPVDPMLRPILYEGNVQPTLPPMPLSPVLNTAVATLDSPVTDQRGVSRSVWLGADLGAHESDDVLPVVEVADTGTGSVRDALSVSGDGTIIYFDPTLSGQTIVLSNGTLVVASDVCLDALVDGTNIVLSGDADSSGGPGFGDVRPLLVETGAALTLKGMIIRHGYASSNSVPADHGGGIYNRGGSVVLLHSILETNKAMLDGGGIYNAGGSLSISGSVLRANHAGNNGGGLYSDGGSVALYGSTLATNAAPVDGGGIYNNGGSLSIFGSVLRANHAGDDGGGVFGALGNITVQDSLVVGNSSGDFGGGILNGVNSTGLILRSSIISNTALDRAGGLYNSGRCDVTNSTIALNKADFGSGIYTTLGNLQLGYTTITHNEAAVSGGGIRHFSDDLTLENCIVSDNTSPTGASIARNGGTLSVIGNNLIGDNETVTNEFPAGTWVGTKAQPRSADLAPSTELGLPVYVPTPASRALGSAIVTAGTPETDQRGVLRPQGFGVELGAIERGGLTNIVVWDTGNSGPGTLRAGVSELSEGGMINFASELDSETIYLTNPVSIFTNMVITGHGLSRAITISGSHTARVFEVLNGEVHFEKLQIAHGVAGSTNEGGGIFVRALAQTQVSLGNCTLYENTAYKGGGLAFFGDDTGRLAISNCTFYGNHALSGFGGALYLVDSPDTVLQQVTVMTNQGVGLTLLGGGHTRIENSIFAHSWIPSGPEPAYDIYGLPAFVTLVGDNLIGVDAPIFIGSLPFGPADLIGTTNAPIDPMLAPAGYYSGPTTTCPPLPGSIVVDAGVLNSNTPSLDQAVRARPAGEGPDLGAVESFAFSSIALIDVDNDGIDDRLEPALGLTVGIDNSGNDSDLDGQDDATEIANMTDPLDDASFFGFTGFEMADGSTTVRATWPSYPGFEYDLLESSMLGGSAFQTNDSYIASGLQSERTVSSSNAPAFFFLQRR